jgi:hypothetical protein
MATPTGSDRTILQDSAKVELPMKAAWVLQIAYRPNFSKTTVRFARTPSWIQRALDDLLLEKKKRPDLNPVVVLDAAIVRTARSW